jgi:pimeloyl-ACP methyl ester carboxylesterase
VLIVYDIDGPDDGPPVVLLHSSVCDRRMWQPQVGPLADAGFRVVRVDFRGYGETPPPSQPYDNARDVLDVLDALGLGRVAVVGASFGGRVGQELAARWPDRVDTLVLLCAAMAGHPPTADIETFVTQEDELLEAGEVDRAVALNIRTFLGPAADDDTMDLVARMQRHAFEVQLSAPDVQASTVDYDLAAITATTVVVSGRHDVDYFQQISEALTARIPDATHLALEWAGHLPSLESPDRLNPILLHALRR